MSRLRSIVVVGAVFCLFILPPNADAKKRIIRVTQQPPSLTLSTTNLSSPDGTKLSTLLTGRYQNDAKVVNLRALLSKVPRAEYMGPPNILPPIGGTQSATAESPSDTESYQNDSEMSRSDGTVMVEAVYQYERSTGQNMLYLTLGGVTLTFNLDTQKAGPITDADQQKLDAWAASEDAALVEEASVAIINDAYQQPENTTEALLNYFVLGMFVDNMPPSESASITRKKDQAVLHHAVGRLLSSRLSRSGYTKNAATCWNNLAIAVTPDNNRSRLASLHAVSGPVGCFGCCGLGCACIPTRWGVPIYGSPCQNHDRCVGQYGYRDSRCWGQFIVAAIYVWYRW